MVDFTIGKYKFTSAINLHSLTGSILVYAFWILLIGGTIWFVAGTVRRRAIYRHGVTLWKRRENGSLKSVHTLKGGVTKNKQGVKDFIIKYGRWPWQKLFLGYIPRMDVTGADDRVHLLQIGDERTLQQIKLDLKTDEQDYDMEAAREALEPLRASLLKKVEGKEYTEKEANELYSIAFQEELQNHKVMKSLLLTPVDTDVLTKGVQDIQNISEVLGVHKITLFAIGMGFLVITFIAQIIFLYFVTKH